MISPSDDFRTPDRFVSMPGWPLAVECCLPNDSDAPTHDICLTGVRCPEHNRTVYYCYDNGVLWCDGMTHAGHVEPHVLLVRVADER